MATIYLPTGLQLGTEYLPDELSKTPIGELLPKGSRFTAINADTGKNYGTAVVLGHVIRHGSYDYDTLAKLSDGSIAMFGPDEIFTEE